MVLSNKIKDSVVLRRLGFTKDQNGIISRYYREKNNWTAHLEKTKDFIIKSTKVYEGGKVAVLGSGWLLDLPLDDLLDIFTEVCLIDIVHPPQIKRKYKDHPRIRFIEKDISGGLIKWTYNFVKENKRNKFLPSINEISLLKPELEEQFDFVISLNILNQLDILPGDYLQKYFPADKFDYRYFRSLIQKAHIEMLSASSGVIIADVEEEYYDDNNQYAGSKPSLFTELPNGKTEDEWDWKFDTHYTYKEDFKTVLKVKAVSF